MYFNFGAQVSAYISFDHFFYSVYDAWTFALHIGQFSMRHTISVADWQNKSAPFRFGITGAMTRVGSSPSNYTLMVLILHSPFSPHSYHYFLWLGSALDLMLLCIHTIHLFVILILYSLHSLIFIPSPPLIAVCWCSLGQTKRRKYV